MKDKELLKLFLANGWEIKSVFYRETYIEVRCYYDIELSSYNP